MMRDVHRLFVLLLLGALFISAPVSAHYLSLGAHHSYTRLKFDNPSDLEGFLAGFSAEGGGEWSCCWGGLFTDLRLEGTWNAGPITGEPCQRSDITEYRAQWDLGLSFCFCDCCLLRPYGGVGYDYFKNDQEPESVDLTYRYTKYFTVAGLELRCYIGEWFALGLKGAWRPDFYSRLKVISEKLEVRRREGYRAELPLTFFLQGRCCSPCWATVTVAPYFDWNRFGKVKEETSLGTPFPVPRLICWSGGVRLLFALNF